MQVRDARRCRPLKRACAHTNPGLWTQRSRRRTARRRGWPRRWRIRGLLDRAASPPSCWRRHLPPTVLAWLPCPVPPAGICSRALDPVAVSGNKLGIGSRRQLRGLPDHSWHVASAQADPNPVEPPADGSTLICFARHAITRPRSTSRHPLDLTPVSRRYFAPGDTDPSTGPTGRHPFPDLSPAWSRIARTSPGRT